MKSIGIVSILTILIVGGDSMSLKGRVATGGSDSSYGTKLMSKLFKDSINTVVNPCQDFFTYVCDGYNQQHPIPDGVGHIGVNEDLQDAVIVNLTLAFKRLSPSKLTSQAQSIQTVSHIFDACVRAKQDDYKGAKMILNIIKEFGGWPILDIDPKSWTPSRLPRDLSWIVGNLYGVHGIATLLTPQVDLDWYNVSGNNILYLNQATLSTPAIYYTISNLTSQTRESVRQQIEMTVRALANRTDETGELDKDAVKKQIEAMVQIEYELATITTPDADERNSSLQYNSYTVDQATKDFDSLNWTNYFAGLTAANQSGDEPPTDKFDQRFILTESKLYLPKLNRWLKTYQQDQEKLKDLINYLIYRLVSPYMLFAGPPLTDAKPMHAGETKKIKNFGDLSFLPQSLPSLLSSKNDDDVSDHEKNCANFIMGFAPYVAGRLYVDSSFPTEARGDVAIMVGNVLAAFKGMLSGLDWIDEQSILRAYKKIDNMIQSVGYPDFQQDDQKLDAYYGELIRLTKNVDPGQYEAFFVYVKTLVAYQMRTMFSQVLKPGDRYDFLMSPAVVNDWYQPERNSITFPAAQLAPPFYGFDFPKAINYGAFGATIGHEMTHGFDDEGVQYDYNGTLHTWMTEQSQVGFKKMAQCVIDEYNGFCYPETGACVNGISTQGENIADNGGLKAAYQAYKAYTFSHGDEQPLPDFPTLTNDQIFFISYGYSWCGQFSKDFLTRQLLTNVHSPYAPRVNGVVKNFAQFGQAFKCNKGDPMFPTTSCDVW